MRYLKCMSLRGWKTKRQDRKTEEFWRRRELQSPLSDYEQFQREWNFIESYYGPEPSNNGLDLANPAFAFDTKLAKYLVEVLVASPDTEEERRLMNTNTQVIEPEEDNVVPFRLATGGTGGGFSNLPPTGDIWLNDLAEGTVFLAELKQTSDPFAHCFIVIKKFDKAVVLDHQVGGQHDIRWAIPHKFSSQWRWILTLDVMPQQEKEEKDGDRDSRPSEPVDSNEEPQSVDQVHEGE